jgi:hypothetical protein
MLTIGEREFEDLDGVERVEGDLSKKASTRLVEKSQPAPNALI